MSELNERNKRIIAEFRANEGKVGGNFEGKALLLLHTTGAKSGQERVNPLACIKDRDRCVVIASKAGADTNPGRYNVIANPHVTVEVGTEILQAHASVAENQSGRVSTTRWWKSCPALTATATKLRV